MLKLVKGLLSPSTRRAVRGFWENLTDWVAVFYTYVYFMFTRKAPPKSLFYFGYAPGDDLLATAVLRELRNRGGCGLLMVSDHGELFAGNHDAAYVRPLWGRYSRDNSTVSICRRLAGLWGGEFIRLEYAPPVGRDRRSQPSRHVIAEMCARAHVVGPVAIRPFLHLSDHEASQGSWARERIAIQSSGMAARHPARNKEWVEGRFQEVVDALKGEADFVQLGAVTDPALRDVKDMRGATTIRQAAAILHHARLYVGGEGLLMHLARAVECPSVIVFGGRLAPWQTGYVCNLNLYSAMPCAPCWQANTCEFDRQCMKDISVAHVVSAIREMLAKPRGPLAVETVEIAPTGRARLPGSGRAGERGR